MIRGEVAAIHLASVGGEPMEAVREARALAGRGLQGDRYAEGAGTHPGDLGGGRQVTLIEAEAIERLREETGIALEPAASRRNILTRGVPLNELVGHEFRVGEARLRGVGLCEPCGYLERKTARGVLRGLLGRGGLRAVVLSGGTIRLGDPVEAVGERESRRVAG